MVIEIDCNNNLDITVYYSDTCSICQFTMDTHKTDCVCGIGSLVAFYVRSLLTIVTRNYKSPLPILGQCDKLVIETVTSLPH